MIDNEIDELSITEDPKFFQELTEEVWKENFEKVGYILTFHKSYTTP